MDDVWNSWGAWQNKGGKVAFSIEEQMLKKNIEIKLIATYAPMLNPTELVFMSFEATNWEAK